MSFSDVLIGYNNYYINQKLITVSIDIDVKRLEGASDACMRWLEAKYIKKCLVHISMESEERSS